MILNSNKSNQLKLNLNAFVDNLNLVNVVHQPNPICIEKKGAGPTIGARACAGTTAFSAVRSSRQSFEYIDEEKLSMYSYLVQRDLKTKEWMSNLASSNVDELKKLCKEKQPKRQAKEIDIDAFIQNQATSKATVELKAFNKPVVNENSSNHTASSASNGPLAKTKPSTQEAQTDLKKCNIDLMRTLEHLAKQLNECKALSDFEDFNFTFKIDLPCG